MWIQQFQVFKKEWITEKQNLVTINDIYYDTQKLAFGWIDEHGDKQTEYVILPVIQFDNEAKD